MRKSTFFATLVLALSMLTGCGSKPKGTIDNSTKEIVLNCKQKVDVVKDALSELTMEESGEYHDDTTTASDNRHLMRKNVPTNYSELSKEKYLTLQNFGLYVMDNVYYSINFGYDSESIGLDQMIYDEVQNELNNNYRNYLKQANKTNKFYMVLNSTEDSLSFNVDWLGDSEYRGDIYVAGNISLGNGEVKSFTVTSFTEDKSCYIYAAHYDFVSNNFYQFNASHNDAEYLNSTKALIAKLNNGQLTTEDLADSEFNELSVASGKITTNIEEIDYHGYLRANYGEGSNKEAFDEIFNSLKDKISLTNVRTASDKLDYSKSTRVHFMDESLQYGLKSTRLYVTAAGSAVFPSASKEKFIAACETVPSSYNEIFTEAKNKLSKKSNTSLFLEYDDEDLQIAESHSNEQYYSLNTYYVDSTCYALTDKKEDETVTFSIKGNSIVNIRSTNLDYVPEEDPNYEVTIKFMNGFGNSVRSQLTSIVTSFNAQYSGKYKVELVSSGSAQDVIDSIQMAASGTVEELPEIIITKSDLLETLVKEDSTRKYLYNFDSFFENSGLGFSDEELAQFDEPLLNDGTSYSVEGRWSLPFDTNDQYMFYDKALFEEKNWAVPTTFEELVNLAYQIKDASNDPRYIPVAFNDTKDILMDVFIQNNIPVLTNRDNPFEFANNEYRTKSLDILNTVKSCLDAGVFSSKDMTMADTYVTDLFSEGKCAIGFMQADAVDFIYNEENLGVAKVPFSNNKQSYVRADCVSSISLLKTGNPYATRGAWLFIKKLLTEFVVDCSLTNNHIPALKYDLSNTQLTGLNYEIASLHNEVRDSFVNTIKVGNLDSIYDELDHVFSSLKNGSTSEQVLDNLLALAQ